MGVKRRKRGRKGANLEKRVWSNVETKNWGEADPAMDEFGDIEKVSSPFCAWYCIS